MYELVNNKKNGIDIDKVLDKSMLLELTNVFQFDYLIRDDRTLGLGLVKFDYEELMLNTAIRSCEGATSLLYDRSQLNNIKNIFLDRARLHRFVN